MRQEIQDRGYLNKEQLFQVVKWKSPRSSGHVHRISNEYVKEVTSFSFAAKTERYRNESLTILDGISWPTASALLHLFHADPYPILDYRALWSLRIDVPKQYKFHFWKSCFTYCRRLAKERNVTMRTLDRALWQYSKENQKA